MQTMEYEMEMIPVDTEKQQIIYEDHSANGGDGASEASPAMLRLYLQREAYAASYHDGYDRLLRDPCKSDQQHQEWG